MNGFPSILPFLPGEEGTSGRFHEVPLGGGGFRGRDFAIKRETIKRDSAAVQLKRL